MNRILAIAVTAMVCFAAAVPAQVVGSVSTGQRVRIRSTAVSGEFVVRAVSADTLVLHKSSTNETYSVPVDAIKRMDVSNGSRGGAARFGRGLGFGFLVGAATGATIGFADGDDTCRPDSWCLFAMSAGEKALVGGVALGAAGGMIGGLVGLVRHSERWQQVPTNRIAVVPLSGGRFAASASLTF